MSSSARSNRVSPDVRPNPQPQDEAPAMESTVRRRRWYNSLQVRLSGLLQRESPRHRQGDTNHTVNINNGPVTTIRRANNVNLVADEDLALLETLPKQPDTSSQWSEYMEDSRTKEIEEIRTWIDNPAVKELVLWIHAAAGLGKSTLARQLQHALRSQNQLAASVFFSQLQTDALGPETVIQLIGGELARTHRRAVPAVAEAVRESHGASVQVQLENYVRNPLLALNLPYPLVVILDAIDEWRSHHHLMSALTHLASHSSLIRVIVLSRSEPNTRIYQNVSIRPYPLLPVSVQVMQDYLNTRFARIEWEFGREPTRTEVLRLAKMANGLFIWLSTVCSVLEKSRTSPQTALAAILYSRRTAGDTGRQLPTLYFKAIQQLFPEPEDRDELRTFLGYTMVLQEPLPLDAFAQISGLSVYSVKRISSSLKALQIRQPVGPEHVVYPAANLFHASFIEYLQSSSTPPDIAFPVPSSTFHSQLGEVCLRMLAGFLPASVDLDQLYLMPAWKYAILYWVWHVSQGAPGVKPGLDAEWKDTASSIILRSSGTLAQLQQWALLFVKSLQLEETLDPPTGDTVECLMRAVAASVSGVRGGAVVFKIPCLEIAVRLAPEDAAAWHELGMAYWNEAEIDDSIELVQHAVASYQHAVEIAKESQPEQYSSYLRALAYGLWLRYERMGVDEDIAKSLSLARELVTLCPPGHPDHSTSLHNLAINLHSHFENFGTVEALDEAILLERETLLLQPPGHPLRSTYLHSLASSLHSRFQQSGTAEALDEAMLLRREILLLRPPGHPHHSTSLHNLANSLYSRFQRLGTVEALDEAILLEREALLLRPPGHPHRSISLHSLAGSLHLRFQQSGTVEALDEAILLGRETLLLRPPGHPHRSTSLHNLAIILHSRFKELGTVEALDEAILLHREALLLLPPGHPNRSTSLINLASSLHSRFKESGSVEALDEVVLLDREALVLCPLGHPDHALELWRLRLALYARFCINGTLDDLLQAISLAEEELDIRMSDNTGRNEVLAWISSHPRPG